MYAPLLILIQSLSAAAAEPATAAVQATAPATPAAGPTFWWGDLDGDGRLDAVVLTAGHPARLLRNSGAGGFDDDAQRAGLPLIQGASAAHWHDIDGDGRQDLLLVVPGGRSRLFLNQADELLLEVSERMPIPLEGVRTARFLDVDGDGAVDLELVGTERDHLLRNVGQGRFEELELDLPARVPSVLTVGTGSQADPSGRTEAGESEGVSSGARLLGARGVDQPVGGSNAPPPASSDLYRSNTSSSSSPTPCVESISDQAMPDFNCIAASSIPLLGHLYPLSQAFNVTAAGRIGIGTTSPAWPIHVEASQSALRLDSLAGTNGSVVELRNKTASPTLLGAINFVNPAGAHQGQIAYTGANAMTFRVNGTEKARIDSGGRLGVGIVPTAPLHVAEKATSIAQVLMPGLRVYRHSFTDDHINVVQGYKTNGVFGGTGKGITISGLVNNAGVGHKGPLNGTSVYDILALNVDALIAMTKAFLPDIERSSGFIINVASVAGLVPIPLMAVYAASKAYVVSFSESLSFETNARVLCICPGPVDTEFHDRAGSPALRRGARSPDQVARETMRALRGRSIVRVTDPSLRCMLRLTGWMPRSWVRSLVKAMSRD